MARAVWKCNLGESLVHELPMGAEPLYAAYQHQDDGSNQICIWLLVNPDQRKLKRAFLVTGTGWTIPDFVNAEMHISSCRNPGNRNCWHVFDLGYLDNLKPFDKRFVESINERSEDMPKFDLNGRV